MRPWRPLRRSTTAPGSWRVGTVALVGTIAMGALVVWAPWQADPLPPGVDLGDCDATQEVSMTISGTFVAEPAADSAPQVVLNSPAIPDGGEVAQRGSTLTIPMHECEGVGVGVELVAADGAGERFEVLSEVEQQRLRAETARVHVNHPSQLPCPEAASCGSWTGWYFTVESGGEGSAVVSTPVQWGPVGGTVDSLGTVEVSVRVDAG